MATSSCIYELRDNDAIIEPFVMMGSEMHDYCVRCLRHLQDNRIVLSTTEAKAILEDELGFTITELF